MSTTSIAAVCGSFGRDLEQCLTQVGEGIGSARARGVSLLAFPEAALGGYLSTLGGSEDPTDPDLDAGPDVGEALPPVLDLDGPELRRVAELAREMTVVIGFCEGDEGGVRYNSAAVLSGDGVLGVHRKVHQPLGENASYAAGEELRAVDTPAGRIGSLICYDKAFPEAARALALDGATTVACISAWPGSRTAGGESLAEDRWTKRFNLFDQARALENQIFWVASNQSGVFGSLRFVCNAKVVGPGGDVLATTGLEAGMAVAEIDVDDALATARRSMFHLRDRRPAIYEAAAAAGLATREQADAGLTEGTSAVHA